MALRRDPTGGARNQEAGFATELNSDVLATVQLMGEETERIQVGSWVANIYLRHPYVCAQAAALIADATGGGMVLGLGVNGSIARSVSLWSRPSPRCALRNRLRRLAVRRGASDASATAAIGASRPDLFRRADVADSRTRRRTG